MVILVDAGKNTYFLTFEELKKLNIDLDKVKKHKGKRELYKEISIFLETHGFIDNFKEVKDSE